MADATFKEDILKLPELTDSIKKQDGRTETEEQKGYSELAAANNALINAVNGLLASVADHTQQSALKTALEAKLTAIQTIQNQVLNAWFADATKPAMTEQQKKEYENLVNPIANGNTEWDNFKNLVNPSNKYKSSFSFFGGAEQSSKKKHRYNITNY